MTFVSASRPFKMRLSRLSGLFKVFALQACLARLCNVLCISITAVKSGLGTGLEICDVESLF